MRRYSVIVVAGGALWLAAGVGLAQQETVKPVASVGQLMEVFTIPLSDAIFDAAVEPPTTDAEWAKVKTAALALAESGNLLMIGGRPPDRREWMTLARAQVEAAEGAMAAADAKDATALTSAADGLSETCYGCHERYLPAALP